MKHVITIAVSLFTIYQVTAQELVSTEVDRAKVASQKEVTYVDKVSALNYKAYTNSEIIYSSKKVKALKSAIAEYDITKNTIYDNSEKATYNVAFKKHNSKAYITYNSEGEILSGVEKYKDITLPVTLRVKILNAYPTFVISSNKLTITYNKRIGLLLAYRVKICNGRQSEILKFDKDFNVID